MKPQASRSTPRGGPFGALAVASLLLTGPLSAAGAPPRAPSSPVVYVEPAHASSPGLSSTLGDTLSILFTAETRGNLVPCSCPTSPRGGLARRVSFLRERAARLAAGGAVLRLDSGGFIPDGETPLHDSPDAAPRFVALLLKALQVGGIQAAALDHRERGFLLRLAPQETAALREVLQEADPPGEARLLAWNDLQVAVIALEETLADSTILRAARNARARSDYLIVLARADAFSARRLARLAGADLVILSRGARPESVLYEGLVPMVGCGADGKEVGEVRLVRKVTLPEAAGGARPTGGALRIVASRLWPMDASVLEDAEIGRQVRALLLDTGMNAASLSGPQE